MLTQETIKNHERKARIKAVRQALLAYSAAKGAPESEPVEDLIGDFLADAMHVCKATAWSFAQLLDRARRNFEAEAGKPVETFRVYKLSHGYGDDRAEEKEMALVWAPNERVARRVAGQVLDSKKFGPRSKLEVTVIELKPDEALVIDQDFDYV